MVLIDNKLEQARLNMVEGQIAPCGIQDLKILNAFRSVPRDLFVSDEDKPFAYSERTLFFDALSQKGRPKRFLMEPRLLALLIQLASVEEKDYVLDVGPASGYSSFILSKLCAHVTACDASLEALEMMTCNIEALNAKNIDVVPTICQPYEGAQETGPYDVILLTVGALPLESHEAIETACAPLFRQLNERGRLVLVAGSLYNMRAWIFLKRNSHVSGREVFDAFMPLGDV